MIPPRPLSLTLAAGLVGCESLSPSATGQWSGSCSRAAQSTYDEPIEVWFELDIVEEDGGILLGDGVFTYDNTDFEGKVRGLRDERSFELELEGSSEAHSTRLEIKGELVDNRVKGVCSLYGVTGELAMSR